MSESRASRPAGLTADELPGHRPALLRYATLQVRETAVAEDLVQNTLVAALQSLDSFRGDASPTTWLIGILKRQIIDHYRRMTRETPLPVSGAGDDPDGAATRTCSTGSSPATVTGQCSRPSGPIPRAASGRRTSWPCSRPASRAWRASPGGSLPSGKSWNSNPRHICKDLGLSQSNYWVLMHRARLRLRQCVERGWMSERS